MLYDENYCINYNELFNFEDLEDKDLWIYYVFKPINCKIKEEEETLFTYKKLKN